MKEFTAEFYKTGQQEMELLTEEAENTMSDERKSKAELLQKLNALRKRICELEQANQAHQNFERQFKELFETTPVGIYRTTPDGRIIMANPALIQMLGYSSFGELSQLNLEKEGFAPGYPRSTFKDLIKRDGKVSGLESAWIKRDGTTLFIIENARAVRDESGKALYYEGIVQDITDRKKAEDKLKEIESIQQSIINSVIESLLLLAPDGTVLAANKLAAERLGTTIDELLGKNAYDFIPNNVAESRRKQVEKVVNTGQPIIFEDVCWKRNILHSLKPVKNSAGIIAKIAIFGLDITKLKQTQDAMRETEGRLRLMVKNSLDYIFQTNIDGTTIYCSPAIERILGYTPEERQGQHFASNISPSDLPKAQALFNEVTEGKAHQNIELNLVHKSGRIVPIEVSVVPIIENNKVSSLFGIARDITERKKAEQALRESEEKYRNLVEEMTDVIYTLDTMGNVTALNKAGKATFGREHEEVLGKSFTKWIPQENLPDAMAAFKRILGGEKITAETVMLDKNGKSHNVEFSSTPIIKDGKIVGTRGVIRDITERKKMEQALLESQRWQRAILDSIPDMAWLKDKEGKYIAANEALCKAFGIKSEDFVGKTDLDISPKDLAEKYRTDDQEVIKSGKRKRVEEQWGKKKGERIWIDTIKTPIYNDQGQVIGTSGIARDVTDRKKLERALIESESKHRALIEQIPAITYTAAIDEASTTTYVSPQIEQILGFSPSDYVADPDIWRKQLHPDDQEWVLTKLKQCHEAGEPFSCEYRMLTKSRQTVWLRDEARIVKDDKGNPIHLQGVMYDITERKKTEQKLRESEEKYRQVVSTSTDAIMLFDAKTRRFVEVNKACEELYGYSREEFLNLKLMDITAEPEKTRESIEQAISGKLHRIPIRYHRKKDGTVFPVEISAGTFEFRGRRVLCGVIRNITERKKAEEKIRALSSAVEQSIDGIAIGDLGPRLLYVNEAYAKMHGFTPEEIIGMPVGKLHSEEQRDSFNTDINLIKSQGFWEGEIGHIKKDGTPFPTYMSATLLKDSEGKPIGILAVARDITEMKRREEELNNYRRKIARSEQLASMGALSAGLAHELNQPLTVITLSIENLLADMETTQHPGTVMDRLREVLDEVSKVTSITRKFRDAAKRGSERIYSHVDLKYVAEKTLNLFDERAQRSKVTIVLRGFNKLPFVCSSEEEMGQLFFALVENAIQAADGKKQRRLVISGAVKGQHIELRFSDNCSGIELGHLGRIFEPFFSTKLAGEATGLGLCIVENVVSRAGGKVHVESKRGKGTTFYITLPVKDGARLPHKAR